MPSATSPGATMTDYVLLNVVAASGMAADACIVTLAMYRWFVTPRRMLKWTSAIATTHTVFPMVGFSIGWMSAQIASTAWMTALYTGSTMVMAWLTLQAIRQETTPDAEIATATLDKHWAFAGLVMAVSYDALIVGVGKIPMTRDWTSTEIWLSFLLVGGVVGLWVALASLVARALAQARLAVSELPHWLTLGAMIEIGVFTFFTGLAAIRAAMGVLTLPEETLTRGALVLAWLVPVFYAGQILEAKRTPPPRELIPAHSESSK